MIKRLLHRCAIFLLLASAVQAHVGSPDIYFDGKAGPYELFVTIRTPSVIPGVAELEVRAENPGVRTIRAVPVPMSGPGAKFAPVADKLTVSSGDGQLFTGSLWMMAPGSWQVRITVEGADGPGSIAIPVPAAATATKGMQRGVAALLACFACLLVAGLIAMAGAAVREARLPPGEAPSAARVRAGRIAMGVAAVIVAGVLWAGNAWWNSEATSYGQEVYKPLQMNAAVSPRNVLTLRLTDPGWLDGPAWAVLFTRSVDDFIPDHNHLMHLYAIREPGLDVVYHLHPDATGPGVFEMQLPSMPAGVYRLYADVVHANGFPETMVSTLALTNPVNGRALGVDEAVGSGPAWNSAHRGAAEFTLPDGYRMCWLQEPKQTLKAKEPLLLRFRLVQPNGAAANDMSLYMGMLGHAAFVKTDGKVFAHIHPSGTVSMEALMLAQNAPSGTQGKAGAGADMPGMDMPETNAPELPATVSFPYGFPAPGRYRIFVQMKHGSSVETGIFDAIVT